MVVVVLPLPCSWLVFVLREQLPSAGSLEACLPMLVIPEYPPVSAPGRFHAVLSLPRFCLGLPQGISCSPLPPTLETLSGPLAVTASYLWPRSLLTPELDLRPQLLDLGMSWFCSELTADIGYVPVYHPQWPEHSPCSRRGFWGCRRQGH